MLKRGETNARMPSLWDKILMGHGVRGVGIVLREVIN